MKNSLLILLFSLIMTVAFAQKQRFYAAYDVFWEYNENTHTLIISGNDIWNTFSEEAFDRIKRGDVMRIVVEKGIRNIPNGAFKSWIGSNNIHHGFENLEEVILPEGLESIWGYAFSGCKKLKKINLPNSLKRIGCKAFYNCDSLEIEKFPPILEYIGAYAFSGTNISRVYIPYKVDFDRDPYYDNPRYEKKYKHIRSSYAFLNCSVLERACVSPTNCVDYMFAGCHHLRYVEIMDGGFLGMNMFDGCRKLDTIVLNSKIKDFPPLFGDKKEDRVNPVIVIIPDGTLKYYQKKAKKDPVNAAMLKFVERSNANITEPIVVQNENLAETTPKNKNAEENITSSQVSITKPCYRIWFGEGNAVLYDKFDTLPLERFKPFPPIESYSGLKKEKYDNGEYYGQFVNSKREGIGKYSWSTWSGDWYIGNWKAGERTGLGEYHSADGDYVIGFYHNNKLNGMAIKVWSNSGKYAGDIYVGEWKYGNREGFGFYYWKQERGSWRLYCGNWRNTKMSGHGIIAKHDGSYLYGVFENDSYKGQPEVITLDEFFRFPEVLPWNIIAKTYIEQEINKWQQKGEFEKTYDWQQRVNEASRQKKVKVLADELRVKYLKNYCPKIRLHLVLGKYDADNETFLVSDSIYGNMIVSLTDKMSPKQFKESWNNVIAVPCYYFTGETIGIKEIEFYLNGDCVAKYDNSTSKNYKIMNIDYNFDPISIPEYAVNRNGRDIIDTVIIGKADVDNNVPVGNTSNNSTYAFIIANENYPIQNVPFALNDGRIFAQYCIKTLGLKRDHVILYENATFGKLMECVEQMKNASKANDGKLDIIFYYAGHAFPDEESKTAWLLPVDGKINLNRTCYSLKQLYNDFADVNANSVVCFIDACFSGATLKKEGRGVAITVKNEIPPTGNIIVFTASTGNETAHQYQEKSHGLFTYYLLKKLQDSKGDVTLGELDEYITTNVKRASFEVNQNLQTPTVIKSLSFQDDEWKSIKLVK